jgi:hypothetical protein
LLQELDIGLGVICRRVDASMPQNQPDLLERNAMEQHLGRRRVSQDVCAFAGATMPVRCIRRFTTDEIPSPFQNGRNGAILRRNT